MFFSRQLEVRYEQAYFHWITNRALRDLEAMGLVRSEWRTLRSGGRVKLLWHRASPAVLPKNPSHKVVRPRTCALHCRTGIAWRATGRGKSSPSPASGPHRGVQSRAYSTSRSVSRVTVMVRQPSADVCPLGIPVRDRGNTHHRRGWRDRTAVIRHGRGPQGIGDMLSHSDNDPRQAPGKLTPGTCRARMGSERCAETNEPR